MRSGTKKPSVAGVAVWLVDFNRPLTTSGALQTMARSGMIVGLTTTPAILLNPSTQAQAILIWQGADREKPVEIGATYHVAKD